MVDEPIEFDAAGTGLNVAGIANVPVCPVCTTELGSAPTDYKYRRNVPDTRWFWCEDCGAHFGYHRMKAKWLIDPFDLNNNNKIREHFGLPAVEDA